MAEGTCSGSNGPPPWPLDRSSAVHFQSCPSCGEKVRVYMRRVNWSRPEHLYLAKHPLASFRDSHRHQQQGER